MFKLIWLITHWYKIFYIFHIILGVYAPTNEVNKLETGIKIFSHKGLSMDVLIDKVGARTVFTSLPWTL